MKLETKKALDHLLSELLKRGVEENAILWAMLLSPVTEGFLVEEHFYFGEDPDRVSRNCERAGINGDAAVPIGLEQLQRELEGMLPRYTKEDIEICFKNWRGE